MADSDKTRSFAEHAELPQVGIVQEFWDFLRFNKKWWLTPIIVVLLMMGTLLFLGGTGAAPFLYTFW